MKSWIIVLCLAVLAACSGTPSSSDGAFVAITIPLTGDECGVADAQATVTGADITPPIGPESLNVKDFAYITGIITDVPLGYARLITVEAFNTLGRIVYAGSASVDILTVDIPTPLDMVLYRNFENCPDTGIICLDPPCYGQVSVNATLSNEAAPAKESSSDPNIDRLLGTVRIWKM